jgi:phospholipase C
VTITNNTNSAVYTLTGNGSQLVTPTTTTTYTATATGLGGTVTAQTTVTVLGPAVTITAAPTSIPLGQPSTLTVTATNSTAVSISGSDGTTYTVSASGGQQVVKPRTTTTYTATATGGGVSATAQVTVTVTAPPPTVTITANPARVAVGGSSTLTVVATDAASVVVTGTDNSTYTLTATGGTQTVAPTATTTYTATATGPGTPPTATASVTVTVVPVGTVNSVNHVIFMLQENRSFDSYFGMLNPYRKANKDSNGNYFNVGDDKNVYNVDGIDDKLTTISNTTDTGNALVPVETFPLFHTSSSCLDDMTSSWLESYGDVSRYDFSLTRSMLMDGFVHTAENYAQDGGPSGGEGTFTDLAGQRAMAYYQDTSPSGAAQLNYYYWMASQFALSDRWFSPVSSKTVPNRIATLSGGTTQGLVFDPFSDDKIVGALGITPIFEELDKATPQVSWKIYYTLTEGGCDTKDGDCGSSTGLSLYPVTTFSDFGYAGLYLYTNPSKAPCKSPTQDSYTAVGDQNHSFCIDPNHIAPLSQFYIDVAKGTNADGGGLADFSYIEPGYGLNDEHPGSGQSIFSGQAEVANILSSFMSSPSWTDSVFFLSYDEPGGPYDHVPPVQGHSNDKTIIANMGYLPGCSVPECAVAVPVGEIPDISTISVNPDNAPGAAALYWPCLDNGPDNAAGDPTPTLHCDLNPGDPGTTNGSAVITPPTDAPAKEGFAAQLGFRLPNMVISPFSRRHYVSHIPMDHTAILKFVESRFIGPTAHLTYRDAAQPDLLDFFDFTGIPWLTPPAAASIPTPPAVGTTCNPTSMQ